MFTLSRRSLLFAASGLAVSALLPRSAWAGAEAPRRRPILCVIFLRGGVDALNVVVPHADAAYRRLRPGIGVPGPGKADGVLDLDGQFGLHPRLAPLRSLFQAKELAVVHAVGSPHPTRSHFEAQDYAETGSVSSSTRDGWLARALGELPKSESLLRAVALSSKRPLALRGGSVDVVSAKSLERFRLRSPKPLGPKFAHAFADLYGAGDDPVVRAGRNALAVERLLRELPPTSRQVKYPDGARPLADIARLVHADAGLEVAFADVGGWDTHQGQGGRLPRLLDGLGKGLAAFRQDLGDRFEDVLVVVMSEFGRTAAENGTGGTDHGHGGAMLLLGGRVVGGQVHGKWPGLEREQLHEGRDLAVTTDYRDVIAEVSRSHLGVTALDRVVPGHTVKPLGILRAR